MTALASMIAPASLDHMAEIARNAPEGDFAELGVYMGGSAQVLYSVALAQGRRLYLFDTFAGHPQPSPVDHANHPKGRFGDPDVSAIRAAMPEAVIVPGIFPVSLLGRSWPVAIRLAFAHVDLDLYDGTKAACEILPHYMVAGGVMIFDDDGLFDCPGVVKALDEHFPNREHFGFRGIVRL